MLPDVLRDFGQELLKIDGWPICFAVGIILAFTPEHFEAKCPLIYMTQKALLESPRRDSIPSTCSGLQQIMEEYRTGALVRVFDHIHVLLRCKLEKQTDSTMGSSLRKDIRDLEETFGKQRK